MEAGVAKPAARSDIEGWWTKASSRLASPCQMPGALVRGATRQGSTASGVGELEELADALCGEVDGCGDGGLGGVVS